MLFYCYKINQAFQYFKTWFFFKKKNLWRVVSFTIFVISSGSCIGFGLKSMQVTYDSQIIIIIINKSKILFETPFQLFDCSPETYRKW